MLNRRDLIAGAVAGLTVASLPALAQEKLAVVASFSILGDFVQRIGGERIALTTLVGPDGDAHVYSPTAADAKVMAAAKLVIVNGLNFEGWMTRLVKSSVAKAPVIAAAGKVTPLKEAGGHNHGHSHGHGHGGADPHAWQDVGNAKLYVAAIRDALVAADPAGKAVYEANADAYLTELTALDADLRAAVQRIPADRRKAITSHDAFAYFEKAYGLDFVSPQGVSTEAEASAKDVARIIRQMKAQKIPAVFLENITNPRLIEQIARETGAKIGGRLYSDALSAPDGPAGSYIAMMKHNISQIEKALGAGPS